MGVRSKTRHAPAYWLHGPRIVGHVTASMLAEVRTPSKTPGLTTAQLVLDQPTGRVFVLPASPISLGHVELPRTRTAARAGRPDDAVLAAFALSWDIDSAMQRFESCRPSQPVKSQRVLSYSDG